MKKYWDFCGIHVPFSLILLSIAEFIISIILPFSNKYRRIVNSMRAYLNLLILKYLPHWAVGVLQFTQRTYFKIPKPNKHITLKNTKIALHRWHNSARIDNNNLKKIQKKSCENAFIHSCLHKQRRNARINTYRKVPYNRKLRLWFP